MTFWNTVMIVRGKVNYFTDKSLINRGIKKKKTQIERLFSFFFFGLEIKKENFSLFINLFFINQTVNHGFP